MKDKYIPNCVIERGEIKEVIDNKYVVNSLDRIGIETSPLGTVNNTTYSVGDRVCYFIFKDGTGSILCMM